MIPPITANTDVEVKDSCNCCSWPWKRRDVYDPNKVRGHKKYRLVERIHEIAIEIRGSNK